MHPSGFKRLVKQMDEIASRIEEEVIIQTGGTNYIPQQAKHFSFAPEEELRRLYRKARVVVTHGGVGTILDVLQEGVSVVVIPRLKKYGEVIDDHQLVFVQELEKQCKITAVYDVQRLEEVLKTVDSPALELKRDRRLVSALKEYIAQFARK
jgi:beta-1,4-N-acetylglucosaminyltransferase